jgi:hypothetical protein
MLKKAPGVWKTRIGHRGNVNQMQAFVMQSVWPGCGDKDVSIISQTSYFVMV